VGPVLFHVHELVDHPPGALEIGTRQEILGQERGPARQVLAIDVRV
jgi:hypothetical protein